MSVAEPTPAELQQLATVHRIHPAGSDLPIPVEETMAAQTIDGCAIDVHRMRLRGASDIYEADIPYMATDREVMLVVLGRVLPPQFTRLKRSGFIIRTNVIEPTASTVVHSQKLFNDMIGYFGFPSTTGLF